MKELLRHTIEAYIDGCQPEIMTNTPTDFPGPEIPTIVTDTEAERPIFFPRRTISRRITSMRPSIKNWGIEMNIRPTWIRYTISLLVIPINNFRRKRCRAPLSRRLKQAETLSDTWIFSIRYDSPINLNSISLYPYSWRPSGCTISPSMQTKTRPIS